MKSTCRSAIRYLHCVPHHATRNCGVTLDRCYRSRQVAKLAPDGWDRSLQVAEGDRSALLETCDVVRHSEMSDERWRRAHPRHIGRLVIDHEGIGGRDMVRQPVPVTQMWTDGNGTDAWVVIDLERPWHAVVGRDDDRMAAIRCG